MSRATDARTRGQRGRRTPGAWACALALAASATAARAADIAVVKSSDVAAWRPAIEALRRATGSHTFTEYDLRNDRATADGVLAGLRGKSFIVVALGPLAAQLVRTNLPDAPLVTFGRQIHDLEIAGLAKTQFAQTLEPRILVFR